MPLGPGFGAERDAAGACYSVKVQRAIVISEQNIVIRYLFSGHWDELAHIARTWRIIRAGALAEICAPAGQCVYLSQNQTLRYIILAEPIVIPFLAAA
jgi:hypothetical protein